MVSRDDEHVTVSGREDGGAPCCCPAPPRTRNAQTVLRYADQRVATADAEIRTWQREGSPGHPNS